MLLAMRDYGTIYSPWRTHQINYLRQYADPKLEGCKELDNGAENAVVKKIYESDDWLSMMSWGQSTLFT